ncbi:uncharacterized protein [Periplaneta americana]|uniref:uncharacterized protein n=1 Tax=Periplaneta americana TaxID=6978 RepID=UPI0037E80A64
MQKIVIWCLQNKWTLSLRDNGTEVVYYADITVKNNYWDWNGPRSEWNGKYFVYAIDYDNFIVIGGCAPEFSPSPLYWVAFRRRCPSSKAYQAAENALKGYNMSITDFYKTCRRRELI